MKVLKEIEHDGRELLVVTDEKGLFIGSRGNIKYYIKELKKTLKKLTNEEILNINKKLLKENYPDMYPQIYGKVE